MITSQDRLEEYKNAIRLHYEHEKTKDYSSFLLNPSRAQLRKLCVERFKNNVSDDDLKSFCLFLGFEFDVKNLNKLQSQTDKFRPIETFLKRETDLSEIEAINIAAVLVDFKPRPFNKFSKLGVEIIDDDKEEFIQKASTTKELKYFVASEKENQIDLKKGNFKKRSAVIFLSLLGIFFASYTAKDIIFPEKECMQWQKDHYELVDCEVTGLVSTNTIEPVNKGLLHLKRIFPCDTTTFFEYDKPKVWYHKMNNDVEFYNSDGKHPVTGRELKPITQHMIDNYIGSCK